MMRHEYERMLPLILQKRNFMQILQENNERNMMATKKELLVFFLCLVYASP